MMKMILIGLAVLVALLVMVGVAMPTTYAVEKSIVIDANPVEVHAYVGNLRKWPEWAPWTGTESPGMTLTSRTVTSAPIVPIIRPPTFAAKLSPVPRRCVG